MLEKTQVEVSRRLSRPPVRDHMSGNGFEDDVRPDLLAQHPEVQGCGDLCGALGGTRTPNLLIRIIEYQNLELRAISDVE